MSGARHVSRPLAPVAVDRWIRPLPSARWHTGQSGATARERLDPNLVSTDEEPHYGKYGMMRKTYLKEHRLAMYSLYMLEDRLVEHLNLVDDEAQERMDILVRQMMEQQGITEELKARDQMEWVRAENNIRNAAEEIVCNELIYR